MTGAEWRACTNFPSLESSARNGASERKLWLYACACCRLTWHLLPDVCRRLVEAVERFAGRELRPRDMASLFDHYYPH